MEPEEVEERRYCESQESWEKVGDPGEKGGCQLHMNTNKPGIRVYLIRWI